jgi:hypothetical protein
MVERIIRLTTEEEDVVLDPFAGSGTVLGMAEAMDRNPIGFELSETYGEMYLDLREQIIDEWDTKMEEGGTLESRQEQLEEIICTLRQLKFPRELTRRVRKDLDADSLEDLGINTAFQLSHEIVDHDKFEEDHLFMEDSLYYVVDDTVSEDKIVSIQQSAEKCADEAPCSKFGIVANIEVVTISEMLELLDSDEWSTWEDDALYLYSNDTQNIYEQVISVGEWKSEVSSPSNWRNKYAENDYPPIISNLKSEVEEDTVEVSAGDNSAEGDKKTLSDF